MIKSNIKIHDRLSFEAKLEFNTDNFKTTKQEFDVEMYIFVPNNFDINAQNFSHTDFYHALKTNIRFSTPAYFFSDLQKPLQTLIDSINKYNPNRVGNYNSLTTNTKRFCSIFRVALRKDIFKISKIKDENKQHKACLNLIRQTQYLRKSFQQLMKYEKIVTNSQINQVFKLSDEYQSITVEEHFSILISIFTKKNNNKAVTILKNGLFNELDYRMRQRYPSIKIESIKSYDILHRKSRLKKYIESNLFLNSETKKDGVLLEQILFSIAAGLAMIFSTGVAFATQKTYGNFTLPFFIALVISYMFKDRIKEMGRIYFDKKQRKLHYDFKTIIYNQNSKKIGSIKERFHIEKKRRIPTKILDLREKVRVTEIGEIFKEDSILFYRNKVNINKITKDDKLSTSGLTEILRYNIFDFTLKMDDSEKWIYRKTDNVWKKQHADRYYYMNVIFRYMFKNHIRHECYKLLMNRNGIKQIKKVG